MKGGCCGPKDPAFDCRDGQERAQTPLSPSRRLCLSNHPALGQWLLRILRGRFCLTSLKALDLVSPEISFGTRCPSHKSRVKEPQGWTLLCLRRCRMEELLFLALSRLCPGHRVQLQALPVGSREGGTLGMTMGCCRVSFSERFSNKQMSG